MTPEEAALAILQEAAGEALHWTVIWDRALQAGHIDPLADPNARQTFMRGLSTASRDGRIEKVSTGTYRVPAG